MPDEKPALSQDQVGNRMLALMEVISESVKRFEYLENLRAEEAIKELAHEEQAAEKRAAAQKAFEERQERGIAVNERTATALERIANTLQEWAVNGISMRGDRL